MFKKKSSLNDGIKKEEVNKIVSDINESVEDDFKKDDTEQTFFINIEFRKIPGTEREIGRISMPQFDNDELKKYLKFAIDLLTSTLRKL